jgi:transketolase
MAEDLDLLCVNSIEVIAIDTIRKANSGHPGMPIGMVTAGYVLWRAFCATIRKNPVGSARGWRGERDEVFDS